MQTNANTQLEAETNEDRRKQTQKHANKRKQSLTPPVFTLPCAVPVSALSKRHALKQRTQNSLHRPSAERSFRKRKMDAKFETMIISEWFSDIFPDICPEMLSRQVEKSSPLISPDLSHHISQISKQNSPQNFKMHFSRHDNAIKNSQRVRLPNLHLKP